MVTNTREYRGTLNQGRIIGEKKIQGVIQPDGFSDDLFKAKFRDDVEVLFGQSTILGIGLH